MKRFKSIVMAIVLAAFTFAGALAQEKPEGLRLPSVVGDNMVLQQKATVNIWGWAKPKSKVSVTGSWDNKTVTVKADPEGMWVAQLQTPAGSFDPVTVTVTAGKESETIKNVLIGEVWLCSGQSNMEWNVKSTLDMKGDLEGELSPYIRLFDTGRVYNEAEQQDVNAFWAICNPDDLATFSAVGYGFGKELFQALNVPIGLIDASYGGTFIEGWLKKSVIDDNPSIVSDCRAIKHKKWAGKESQLYNANIYPIRLTTIAGVIWYQGCANVASRPRNYGYSLRTLIDSWREEFRNPEMPFYIVQIAPHTYGGIKGALVREGQAATADKTDHCEVVITNDQQEIPGDIHPRLKADVSHRLAQCALGEHYGVSKAEFRSPAYESMTVEGNAVRIRLKNVPTKIVAHGDFINGFQIAEQTDPNNPKKIRFALANAEIQPDNSILVWSDEIKNPVAVRYCFNEDIGNVFSAEGLPLGAFRTDDNYSAIGVRPRIDTPSEISVTFEGKGYKKSTFTEGAHMWPNLQQVLSDDYPKEFEGFEMLTANSVKKVYTAGGKITAHGDGRVYCIARNTKDLLKACTKNGWRTIIPAWLKAITPDGRKISTQYVVYKDVKDGEVVELPRVKDHYSVFLLAKSIEYIPTEE